MLKLIEKPTMSISSVHICVIIHTTLYNTYELASIKRMWLYKFLLDMHAIYIKKKWEEMNIHGLQNFIE